MFEMLTGTVPFYDADPLKIAQAFTSQQIVPPHLKNPAVPKLLSEAVMKALTVNLGDRYLSAQAMLEALKKLKDGVARETRPLGNAVSGAFGSGNMPLQRPTPTSSTQQRMCKFCFKPLPRMAHTCPSCGEKN